MIFVVITVFLTIIFSYSPRMETSLPVDADTIDCIRENIDLLQVPSSFENPLSSTMMEYPDEQTFSTSFQKQLNSTMIEEPSLECPQVTNVEILHVQNERKQKVQTKKRRDSEGKTTINLNLDIKIGQNRKLVSFL